VTSLPGLDESMDSKLVQYAGHIEINAKKGSNIYYWLFEKPDNPQDGTGSSLYIFIFSIFAYDFLYVVFCVCRFSLLCWRFRNFANVLLHTQKIRRPFCTNKNTGGIYGYQR
jgi:hypothetical protein